MQIFRRGNLNCVLGCYILVFAPIFCFIFGRVDFGSSPPTENIGVILAPKHFWNYSSGAEVSHTPSQISKCLENENLVIPRHIPADHQLFLRYRHCREFPRLLTPRACDHDLFLLLAVKSTAAQIDRRMALRNTWGEEGTIAGKKVRLVFLLGRSQDTVKGYALQRLLKYESRRFGDILQWDFMDSFFNLTLKEVHFLRWFSQECQTAQFVLKGDDDVFIHTRNLLQFLQDKSPSNHLFTGDIIENAWPIRGRRLKYFIPVEMFPHKQYPPYAGGGGYLMSRRTVIGLNQAAQGTELFPIDDVFVGMCLQKMNVTLVFHDGFKTFGYRQSVTPFNPCIYRDLMLVHKLNPTEMWSMWSMVNDPDLTCFKRSIKP
ncbi:N-acetyllactosaminide beta-1,3-N-acetylglucosaminyltransferase 4-like [Conger conger]|uniref:N-acetyllactosaminide beta-1,3-N-acetylglucosaminyltransferase 4-like n=1 Tax=Conger conger TaxID=82655 RepID=UPI002A5A9292|nr:N-acetyllactosaminide beta-1,3-N-acetylglucosaminyltransferase 4-like [Conger conger]